MRHIKFCKIYKDIENPDVKTILEKYAYILKLSKFTSAINENSLTFKRFINLLTDIHGARVLGGIILRSGTINIEIKRKRLNVYWKIPLFTVWLRALLFGLVFSLPYYFMSTNKDIYDTLILFISVFLITTIISFIALKIKVSEINGSVF